MSTTKIIHFEPYVGNYYIQLNNSNLEVLKIKAEDKEVASCMVDIELNHFELGWCSFPGILYIYNGKGWGKLVYKYDFSKQPFEVDILV